MLHLPRVKTLTVEVEATFFSGVIVAEPLTVGIIFTLRETTVVAELGRCPQGGAVGTEARYVTYLQHNNELFYTESNTVNFTPRASLKLKLTDIYS